MLFVKEQGLAIDYLCTFISCGKAIFQKSNVSFPDILQFAEQSTNSERVLNLSSFNDHWGDMQPAYQNDRIRCFAYVAQDEYGIRVNTLQAYATINREVSNIVLFQQKRVFKKSNSYFSS